MDNIGSWFIGYTLVDITNTGVIKYEPALKLKRDQQRNWETVLQVISLRAQPFHVSSSIFPRESSMDLMEFGSSYVGIQKFWQFKFYIEHNDIFGSYTEHDFVSLKDFDQVPIITSLTETAKFEYPIFFTSGEKKNVYFKFL